MDRKESDEQLLLQIGVPDLDRVDPARTLGRVPMLNSAETHMSSIVSVEFEAKWNKWLHDQEVQLEIVSFDEIESLLNKVAVSERLVLFQRLVVIAGNVLGKQVPLFDQFKGRKYAEWLVQVFKTVFTQWGDDELFQILSESATLSLLIERLTQENFSLGSTGVLVGSFNEVFLKGPPRPFFESRIRAIIIKLLKTSRMSRLRSFAMLVLLELHFEGSALKVSTTTPESFEQSIEMFLPSYIEGRRLEELWTFVDHLFELVVAFHEAILLDIWDLISLLGCLVEEFPQRQAEIFDRVFHFPGVLALIHKTNSWQLQTQMASFLSDAQFVESRLYDIDPVVHANALIRLIGVRLPFAEFEQQKSESRQLFDFALSNPRVKSHFIHTQLTQGVPLPKLIRYASSCAVLTDEIREALVSWSSIERGFPLSNEYSILGLTISVIRRLDAIPPPQAVHIRHLIHWTISVYLQSLNNPDLDTCLTNLPLVLAADSLSRVIDCVPENAQIRSAFSDSLDDVRCLRSLASRYKVGEFMLQGLRRTQIELSTAHFMAQKQFLPALWSKLLHSDATFRKSLRKWSRRHKVDPSLLPIRARHGTPILDALLAAEDVASQGVDITSMVYHYLSNDRELSHAATVQYVRIALIQETAMCQMFVVGIRVAMSLRFISSSEDENAQDVWEEFPRTVKAILALCSVHTVPRLTKQDAPVKLLPIDLIRQLYDLFRLPLLYQRHLPRAS